MAIRSLMSVAMTTTPITRPSSERRGEALNISSTSVPSLRRAVIRLRERDSPLRIRSKPTSAPGSSRFALKLRTWPPIISSGPKPSTSRHASLMNRIRPSTPISTITSVEVSTRAR